MSEQNLIEKNGKQKRAEYIASCKNVMQEYLANHNLLIGYVRERKYSPLINSKLYETRIKGIRSILELTNGRISNENGVVLAKAILGAEGENVTNEMFESVRQNWLWKKSPVRGVVVTYQKNGETYIGWSLCNPADDWNRHMGIVKAIKFSDTVELVLADHEKAIKYQVAEEIMDGPDFEDFQREVVQKFLEEQGIPVTQLPSEEPEMVDKGILIPHSVISQFNLMLDKAKKVYAKKQSV